ncbi:hypothetical protein ACQP04_35665 [Pseudonocardia halophobica]
MPREQSPGKPTTRSAAADVHVFTVLTTLRSLARRIRAPQGEAAH